ncbi:MAG: FecR family protein [bacterium]
MKITSIKAICAVILLAAALSVRAAAAEDAAVLSYAQGSVHVKHNGESAWGAYELNSTLQVGDSIKTGPNSKARIVLEDGASILIGPLSLFTISNVTVNDENGERKTSFALDSGKARSNVNKMKTTDSTFEVTTPTAVAAVRGTDFLVEIDSETQDSDVTVFDGEVEFGSALPGKAGERVRLFKDQISRIGRNRGPDKPRKLDMERIQRLKQEMSRIISEKKGEVAEGIDDNQATAVIAAGRSKLSAGKRAEIVEKIRTGEISPDQVKEVVALTHRGLGAGLTERALKIIEERNMTDDEVRSLAKRIKEKINDANAKAAIDDFEKKAVEKPKREKPREKQKVKPDNKEKPFKGKKNKN